MPKVGQTILFAYGGGSIKKTGLYERVIELLEENNKKIIEFGGILSNPTYQMVQQGAKLVKDNNVDFILAVGGGSVIDCCKIIAAQAKLEQDIWDFEINQKKLPDNYISMGVIVTASGTGSEMNNAAGITNEGFNVKTGMFGAQASFAVLDPLLTMTVPFKQVISGGFDTLSHAMETYFGKNENVSDDISIAIMKNTITNLRRVIGDPEDIEARSELMWDSAMAENGILKLGKITDFQAHRIEHQLAAYFNTNHGQGLAVLHPTVYKHIYKDGLTKFVRFAQEVWSVDGESDEDIAYQGIVYLENFIKEIGLPTRLKDLGIEGGELLEKAAMTTAISPGCCKQMTNEEILEILKECL